MLAQLHSPGSRAAQGTLPHQPVTGCCQRLCRDLWSHAVQWVLDSSESSCCKPLPDVKLGPRLTKS